MLVDNPRRIFATRGCVLSDDPDPDDQHPISDAGRTDPRRPAVTVRAARSPGPNWTPSTNRLARAYAELASGTGDYVTIVLPNSIEFLEATIACWKLGAVPQPLAAADAGPGIRGPPRAAPTGADGRPRRTPVVKSPVSPPISVPDGTYSDDPLPEAVSPAWKSMASGGSTGRPKLIEVGGDSRYPGAFSGRR